MAKYIHPHSRNLQSVASAAPVPTTAASAATVSAVAATHTTLVDLFYNKIYNLFYDGLKKKSRNRYWLHVITQNKNYLDQFNTNKYNNDIFLLYLKTLNPPLDSAYNFNKYLEDFYKRFTIFYNSFKSICDNYYSNDFISRIKIDYALKFIHELSYSNEKIKDDLVNALFYEVDVTLALLNEQFMVLNIHTPRAGDIIIYNNKFKYPYFLQVDVKSSNIILYDMFVYYKNNSDNYTKNNPKQKSSGDDFLPVELNHNKLLLKDCIKFMKSIYLLFNDDDRLPDVFKKKKSKTKSKKKNRSLPTASTKVIKRRTRSAPAKVSLPAHDKVSPTASPTATASASASASPPAKQTVKRKTKKKI